VNRLDSGDYLSIDRCCAVEEHLCLTPSPALRGLALVSALSLSSAAIASNFSYSGTFTFDSDLEQIPFTLTGPALVSVITYGYGGGTNSANQTFVAGGFAPSLALYLVSNSSLQAQDALGGSVLAGGGSCSNGTQEDLSVTLCLDATLNFNAIAGGYLLILSEQGVNDGQDPMSYPLSPGTDVTTPPFFDPFGNQRDGQWALDFEITPASSVPEPATFALALGGIAGIALIQRRVKWKVRKSRSSGKKQKNAQTIETGNTGGRFAADVGVGGGWRPDQGYLHHHDEYGGQFREPSFHGCRGRSDRAGRIQPGVSAGKPDAQPGRESRPDLLREPRGHDRQRHRCFRSAGLE
jgi:hypothetical protein